MAMCVMTIIGRVESTISALKASIQGVHLVESRFATVSSNRRFEVSDSKFPTQSLRLFAHRALCPSICLPKPRGPTASQVESAAHRPLSLSAL
jgi:hypothetical protein